MARTILSRYLDPVVLGRISGRRIEPRGLVLGNLAGAPKSPLSGFAVELAGHREYVWGDDPKHIDWRVYYKRQRFFVKQYEMETNLVCHFVLDSSASMRYGEGEQQKLRYAAKMIARPRIWPAASGLRPIALADMPARMPMPMPGPRTPRAARPAPRRSMVRDPP